MKRFFDILTLRLCFSYTDKILKKLMTQNLSTKKILKFYHKNKIIIKNDLFIDNGGNRVFGVVTT